jgi:hypothetical protein
LTNKESGKMTNIQVKRQSIDANLEMTQRLDFKAAAQTTLHEVKVNICKVSER